MALNEFLALYRAMELADRRDHLDIPSGSDGCDRGSILRELLLRQPAEIALRRLAMIAMIRQRIADRGSDIDMDRVDRTLLVMNEVAREAFISPDARDLAYLPTPVKIGHDQTLSHPHVVAIIVAAANITGEACVLDVGTGSGYQAAILSRLADVVVSVEIVPSLADEAKERLRRLGFANIEVITGDGADGAPGYGPFDAILVAAGAASIPGMLLKKLKVGGRLVMPIGRTSTREQLIVATRVTSDDVRLCSLGPAQFVPLTGTGSREEPDQQTEPLEFELCYRAALT